MHFITDRSMLLQFLEQLDPLTEAQFGTLKPHHMVEHLCLAVSVSNGIVSSNPPPDPIRAEKAKQFMIYTDRTFPRGVRVTNPDGSLPELKFETINLAKEELRNQIQTFDAYFDQNPSSTPIHPVLGSLNHDEWIIFHSKHFTHHFTQFGLLDWLEA